MSTEKPSHLERAIFKTLLFFDIFEYPLTDAELRKFLLSEEGTTHSLSAIRDCLSSSSFLGARIVSREGLSHLAGRDCLRMRRRERAIYSYRKYARAKRFSALLACMPFVRMVCVCNTLGLHVARDESDIDLFIVARAGHLWTTRLLCAGLAHVLRIRPRKGRERDTFCLSFYVSDGALDLSSLQLPGWNPDLYLVFWIVWCVPIYDDEVYGLFFEKNMWITRVLPNAFPYESIPRQRVILSPIMRGIKRGGEACIRCFGGIIERAARSVQLRILPPAIRAQINAGTGVVVSEIVLKFHTADRRKEIQETFLVRCKEYGV